ncbi:MAG: ABC transporter ATP-binding protein [Bryobacteraceae bacterium]
MILCRNVVKRFGSFTALGGIDLDLPGGICALLGPNGAGKSTLLKVLTGLLAPDLGSIEIAGYDPSKDPLLLKRSIGVLPEDLGLFDALTIAEHLDLAGPIYGLTREETRERGDALLRVLGIDKTRHTFLDQSSHGMRKKTALAMALLHNPRVLFLDEPFEGIDPVSSKAIQDLLKAVAARGITVFLTSHVLSIVDTLATDIRMIRGGRIVFSSRMADVTRPLEELYFDLVEPPLTEDLPWLRSSPS